VPTDQIYGVPGVSGITSDNIPPDTPLCVPATCIAALSGEPSIAHLSVEAYNCMHECLRHYALRLQLGAYVIVLAPAGGGCRLRTLLRIFPMAFGGGFPSCQDYSPPE